MEGETRAEKEVKGNGTIERWVKKHLLLYRGATRHPFILSIHDGSIDLSSFKRWLEQDYAFVREFVPFVASVLIKASRNSDQRDDMEVILGGLGALEDEISWFKQEASKWDVSLSNITLHKSNRNYCRLLESLMSPEVNYAVAITALWAIEAIYQESFALCLQCGSKTPSELLGVCQRWGNKEFGAYCTTLERIANCCLENASDDLWTKAEAVFLRVLEHEIEFWNMSHGGT